MEAAAAARATSRPGIGLAAGCLLALVLVGLAWSLASPVASSPDDDFHLATIWCETGTTDFCVRTGEEVEEGVERVRVLPELAEGRPCFAFDAELSAACQADAVGGELVRGRANDGLYPSGFYRAMSVLAGENVERSVFAMRMVSWLVAVGLLAGAAAVAGPALRGAFALACLTTLVPLGVFLLASTNPSGLAVASIAAFWCAGLTFMLAEDSRRVAAAGALALVGAAAALLSRSDAGIFLAIAALAACAAAAGERPRRRTRWLLPLGAGAVGALAAVLGRQNQRWADELGVEDRSLVAAVFESALELPRRVLGALGFVELGWLDTPMPALTSFLMLVAFGGVVVVGLGVMFREKWLALVFVVGAIVALPLAVLTSGQNVQPRYVLPLLPVLAGTALLSRRGDAKLELNRPQLLVVAIAVVIAHGAALHRTIRRYVTGVDEGGIDLGEGAEWWWDDLPGPMGVWLLGASAFAVAVACGLALLGRRRDAV